MGRRGTIPTPFLLPLYDPRNGTSRIPLGCIRDVPLIVSPCKVPDKRPRFVFNRPLRPRRFRSTDGYNKPIVSKRFLTSGYSSSRPRFFSVSINNNTLGSSNIYTRV